jgi:hypothetical protein
MFHAGTITAAAEAATPHPWGRPPECERRAGDRPADADESGADRARRHLRMLAELAEIGMDMARAVRDQAVGEARDGAGGDLGLAYSRIARAVRLTLAVETRTAEALGARLAEEAQARTWAQDEARRQAWDRQAQARDARDDAVRRALEQVIEAETGENDAFERLLEAANERLEEEDDADDDADRPIGEIVARICRDLNLSPDWSRWAGEDWAQKDWADEGWAREDAASEDSEDEDGANVEARAAGPPETAAGGGTDAPDPAVAKLFSG